jgi:hypothetical protein
VALECKAATSVGKTGAAANDPKPTFRMTFDDFDDNVAVAFLLWSVREDIYDGSEWAKTRRPSGDDKIWENLK